MVRESLPGRTKTRLGREMGMVAAAWWYRHQCRRLIREVACDRRWRTILAVSPDVAGMTSRFWPAGITRVPQGRGDLGQRMTRLLSHRGSGPRIVIGSDIPGVRRHHIARAFAALGRHDAVFGPAEDGGFWLVGLRRRPPVGMFRGVRWSTSHVLADGLETMPDLSVALIDRLRDVDTVQDL